MYLVELGSFPTTCKKMFFLVLGDTERLSMCAYFVIQALICPSSCPCTRLAPCSALGCPSMPVQALLLWPSPRFPPTFAHDFEELPCVLHLCISSSKHSFHPDTSRECVTNTTSVLEEEEEEGDRRGLGGGRKINPKKAFLLRLTGVRIELSASPASHMLLLPQ